MNLRRVVTLAGLAVLVLFAVRVGSARPAADDANAFAAVDAQILGEIRSHSQAMDNLEYLSYEIGPRLTGSPQLKQANDWTAAKFREYGLSNVNLEPWTIAHSWARGTAHARIVTPTEHPLTIAAAGWSPSTRLTGSPQLEQASHWSVERFNELGLANAKLEPWTIANSWTRGPATGQVISPTYHLLTLETAGWSAATRGALRGRVIGISVEKPEDFQQYKGKLKGAIVIVGRPRAMVSPGHPLLTPWGDETIPVATPKMDDHKPFDFEAYLKLRQAQTKFFTEEGAVEVLEGLEKWYGVLNMGAIGREYAPSVIPTAFMTRENYTLLWRLLDAGAVEAEVNIGSSFSGRPVEVYNTVAEISGTEKPDEVVIVGGHLDSWDLGTGATDNGTGSMTVLEAARALQKLGIKPKRTIRFVLFTGEEQGLNGSKAYVQAHKDELAKISGVLVHDTGTGKVLTIGLMGNYKVRETIDRVLYPMAEPLGIMEPSLRSEGGSDHVPFDTAGVPGFWCVQEVADYDKMHHSQADVLDHVRWEDLAEGAQVLAVFAYNVAELPELLPRKPAKKEETK